MSTPKEFTITD